MKKSAKTKATTLAKHRKRFRDISPSGQVEVRGNVVILYEPLKSKIAQICKNKQITLQQYWDEFCLPLLLKEAKAAKVKKPRAQRAKHA